MFRSMNEFINLGLPKRKIIIAEEPLWKIINQYQASEWFMFDKYWFEPAKRLYIKNSPVVRVLSSRFRAIVVLPWGVFLH